MSRKKRRRFGETTAFSWLSGALVRERHFWWKNWRPLGEKNVILGEERRPFGEKSGIS
jgi:hypothetical protein